MTYHVSAVNAATTPTMIIVPVRLDEVKLGDTLIVGATWSPSDEDLIALVRAIGADRVFDAVVAS